MSISYSSADWQSTVGELFRTAAKHVAGYVVYHFLTFQNIEFVGTQTQIDKDAKYEIIRGWSLTNFFQLPLSLFSSGFASKPPI